MGCLVYLVCTRVLQMVHKMTLFANKGRTRVKGGLGDWVEEIVGTPSKVGA